MAKSIYETKDGDRLDEICFDHYGSTEGTVEFTLENNPHLRAKGIYLDAGVKIELLEMPQQATSNQFDPWNL